MWNSLVKVLVFLLVETYFSFWNLAYILVTSKNDRFWPVCDISLSLSEFYTN